MSLIVLDGERCILGRLASFAAKQALQGNEVIIVNSEKVFITGNKEDILNTYLIMRKKGKSGKMMGPFFPILPERILRRTIRGMLRHSEGRGKIAFKKIKCYSGVPEKFAKIEKISNCKTSDGKKGISLEELSRLLKGGG